MRTSTRRQPVDFGWEAMAKIAGNPVPGDVAGTMVEMGLHVTRVADYEAHCKCPMHFARVGKEDRHPSFSVNTIAGSFFCFSCGYKGNFVDLARDVMGISHAAALEWCRERGGIERAKMILDKGVEEEDTTKRITEARLALFVDPPEKARRKRRLTLEACRALGVLWDTKRDCWIVPIRQPFGGRLLGWQAKNERFFENYPKGVRKREVLFGFDECEDDKVVIVVESPLDVVRMWSAGYTNVVATYGSKVSEEQVRLLVNRFEVIVWAFDNDESGWSTTKELVKDLLASPVRQRVLTYDHVPGNVKDPGEMTDAEIYRAVEKAVPAVTWRRACS